MGKENENKFVKLINIIREKGYIDEFDEPSLGLRSAHKEIKSRVEELADDDMNLYIDGEYIADETADMYILVDMNQLEFDEWREKLDESRDRRRAQLKDF